MPRPIHFEIIAPDPAALASFYQAYVTDPQGVLMGLHQEDASAS
ncbi:MAG: hypothetical protein OXG64_06075 [Chloroflexi bacterium]|nr:hypothetical protein [Chloroflexota bacterium]MCY3956880.1 hypothetical protein [Chloroflexota bacterium]